MGTTPQYFGSLSDGVLTQNPEGFLVFGKDGISGQLSLKARWDNWADLAPKVGDLHPNVDWLYVKEVRVELRPAHVDLLITYDLVGGDELETPSDSTPGLTPSDIPPDEYAMDGATAAVPIQLHPDFATFRGASAGKALNAQGQHVTDYQHWDVQRGEFRPASAKYGVTHYLRPTVTLTWTKYFRTRPTAPEALDGLGTREAPPVWAAGTADNWLVIACQVYRSGFFWVRRKVYQYDAAGWDTDIYDT